MYECPVEEAGRKTGSGQSDSSNDVVLIESTKEYSAVKVFVSVTTTRKRLGLFFYAFQSLIRQDYGDFEIVINLSREAYLFDDGINSIPDWMGGENVQVNFVENTGSYRKLVPLIETVGEEDLVVTADDDMLYSNQWLSRIVKEAGKYPDLLVCGGARRIKKNIFGRVQNYLGWPLCITSETAMDLIPLSGFGAAYRKKLVDLNFITDAAFREYAPTADDLWFRIASMRKNVCVHVNPDIAQGNATITHKMGLDQVNFRTKQKPQGFLARAMSQLKLEFCSYFGIRLSKNDFAWKAASDYSRSKPVTE